MRTSIATVCIGGTLEAKLAATAAAGFDGIELFENDLIGSDLSPEDLRLLCADLGLSIDLYQPFRDFEGVSPEQLAKNLRRAEHKFELMHRLGTNTILLCSNVGTAIDDSDALAIDQLGQLGELAAKHDIRVAYEALAWGKNVSRFLHSWRIVEAVDHPNVGVCLDSFHILSRGDDPAGIAAIPGEKIFFCQLADAPALNMDVLSWSRHYRLFPGEGAWDLPGFVSRVLDAGYTGPLSLEVFNDVFRQTDPFLTAKEAYRSLMSLEEAVGATSISDRSSTADTTPRPSVPVAPITSGLGFVELSEGLGHETQHLLRALGFAEVGPHRRKNVSLWTRDGVNIVVNHDLTGPAAIASLGVDVPDIAAASERATALHAEPTHRDETDDEDSMPGFVTPDGTKLFFSADTRRWRGEFPDRSEDRSPASGTPRFSGFDHIALMQPWQRADEAVLFYRSVLGLTGAGSLDVPGVRGLVQSRTLESPGATLRLALNVPPGEPHAETVLPVHLALACNDLITTVRELKRDGVQLLPIPRNYYDDLQARFDLTDAQTELYRSLNILFDHDSTGSFLQAYTTTGGNLFIELVERQGGYSGYGAANAPVRMASQQRRTPA